MLRVTVDLVPGGFEPGRRTIASMAIGNISMLADTSDYRVDAIEAANPLIGTPPRMATWGSVAGNHDRHQARRGALIEKAARGIPAPNTTEDVAAAGRAVVESSGVVRHQPQKTGAAASYALSTASSATRSRCAPWQSAFTVLRKKRDCFPRRTLS